MATQTEFYTANDDEDYVESGISSTELLAQSFTIGNVGINIDFVVASVDVKLTLMVGATSAVVNASLYEMDLSNKPAGSAISTGSVNINKFSTTAGGTWGNIPMSSASLKRGSKYALVLKGVGTVGYWRADGTTPTYTGGNAIWSSNTGTTWTIDTTTDLMFAINGQDTDGTLCTVSEATFKAGSGANTTAINPLLVKQFINQAESRINSFTRFDWTAIYSTLKASKKYILNDLCSNLAAVYIINYDDTSYTSGLEYERKIAVLKAENVLLFAKLLDEEIRSFIQKV